MKEVIWIGLCVGLSSSAFAAIDTDSPLICAPSQYTECTPSGCEQVNSSEINAPRFIKVDAKRKRMESLQGGANAISKVDHIERIDGKLILQGVEDGIEGVRDGIGYSIAIVEENGDMVMSAASEGVSFSAFGACTNFP
jgi:hypothetical protein